MDPITIEGSEVFIGDTCAGSLADAKANYPLRADEIQAAWDALHPAPVE